MTTARVGHSATLLGNGKVLIAGGIGPANRPVASAELYDPVTRTFSSTGNLAIGRSGHTATLLSNGKVLVAGGSEVINGPIPTVLPLASAELYDPATSTFSPTGNMTRARGSAVAALLNSGQVLIAGDAYMTAEIYDPATGSFSATGNMLTDRQGPAGTRLSDGTILIAGGYGILAFIHPSAEVYDPNSGTFSRTGNMTTGRVFHTATLLPNGKVLIAGGYSTNFPHASAEVYDPATGKFSTSGSMGTDRYSHTATLLPNGKVLVAGGFSSSGPVATAELYDPTSGAFSFTGNMSTARRNHKATLLPNGNVLIAGGFGFPGPALASAELYITNRPPVANAGPDQTVECAGASGASVTLNGSGSSDPDGDTLSYVWKDGSGNVVGNAAIVTLIVPLGTRTFTLTVDDGKGGNASANVPVTVRDSTPPTLSVLLTPKVLWPPNHLLSPVTASIQLNDTCDASPSVKLVSITSNEPDNGLGDGDTPIDIDGAAFNTDDRSFSLRAERSAKGSGRAYTVTYRATDAAGNTADASAQVTVPLDQRKP
ncbi:MAG: hypothetical protein HYS38_10040 [Acidobacteria bacterium]|nr:hypothetical protein [Acidobacteriota bacterium]